MKLNESTISMILGGLVVLVVGVLIYNYFTSVDQGLDSLEDLTPSDGVELVEEAGQLVPRGLPTTHSVAQGEDLWSIAETFYGSGYNWVDIARENNLVNPNRILTGQELTIPKTAVITPVADKAEISELAVISGNSYEVVKGDSLWNIAVRAYQDGYKWVEVAAANRETVANPNVIEEGMMLSLPR